MASPITEVQVYPKPRKQKAPLPSPNAVQVFYSKLIKSGFLSYNQVISFRKIVEEVGTESKKAANNDAAVVKFLNKCFDFGLDINAVNKEKENLLIWLCKTWTDGGLSLLVGLLLSKKIDLNYTEPKTSTNALLAIVKNPERCWFDAVRAAELLVKSGINVKHRDSLGIDALWEVCRSTWNYLTQNRAKVAYSLLKLFIEHGANIFYSPGVSIAPNPFVLLLKAGGNSLRRYNAAEGDFLHQIAELFILGGIDVNAKASDGSNALTLLIKNFFRPPCAIDSRHRIAALLIESGASLDVVDPSGRNLVNILTSIPQFLDDEKDVEELKSTIQLLLFNGVDVNNIDNNGNNALLNLVMSVRKRAAEDDTPTSPSNRRQRPSTSTRTRAKEPLILPIVEALENAGIDCNIRNSAGKDVRDLLFSRRDVLPRMTATVLKYLGLSGEMIFYATEASASEFVDVPDSDSVEDCDVAAGRGLKRKAEEDVVVVQYVKRPYFVAAGYRNSQRYTLLDYQNVIGFENFNYIRNAYKC